MTFFNKLLKQRKNRRAKKTRQQRRLSIEKVEDRRLMAADVMLTDGGDIEINGTNQGDWALVDVADDTLRVTVSTETDASEVYEFPRADVKRLVFRGEEGADVFVNNTGIPSIATGGDDNDTLIGGSVRDVFFGGPGNDNIYSRDGNDEIRAGKGNDWVDGGRGKDNIWGASGTDILLGGDDDDKIFGGANGDIILGQRGNDVVSGEAGYDFVDGGQDNDFVYGGDQMDIVTGGLGVDEVRGGGAADLYLVREYDDLVGFVNDWDYRIDLAATDAVYLLVATSGTDSSAIGIIRGVSEYDPPPTVEVIMSLDNSAMTDGSYTTFDALDLFAFNSGDFVAMEEIIAFNNGNPVSEAADQMDIEIVALSLVSTEPVDLGPLGGQGHWYLLLGNSEGVLAFESPSGALVFESPWGPLGFESPMGPLF